MTTHSPSAARFLLGRAVVTLVTLVAMVAAITLTTTRLPFERHDKARFATISPLPDRALPPALQPGDRIVFQEQSPAVRAVLAVPAVPVGATYNFVIHRGTQVLTVPVSAVPSPDDDSFLSVVNLVTVMVISLLGLLTLWRGTSWSAWGLTMFTTGVLCGTTVAQIPVAPFGNLAFSITGFVLMSPLPFAGLYLTVLDLTGQSARARPRLTLLFAATLFAILLCEILTIADMLAFGLGGAIFSVLSGCIAAVMLAIPLLVLATGYVAAGAEQKLRIRWVLTGTAMLVPLLMTSFVDQLHLLARVDMQHLLTVVRALLTAAIFSFYAYAVLSQRLVEVRIVINRALVFGALMMMVVGAMGAAESLIERTALGTRESMALELAVPLALGIVFHRLHRWIESAVDHLIFRSEHASRRALRDFVRDAGFIENADTLVTRLVSAFARHAGGRGAALFEWRGGAMECLAQEGLATWPGLIDPDDPALVRLRATLTPLDLHESESAFGSNGLALPLALRGRIFGVLVCGPRPAGRYAQAETSELGQAAHDVGASLFALRARANEVLIERLAQGQLHADRAVSEARRLAGIS